MIQRLLLVCLFGLPLALPDTAPRTVEVSVQRAHGEDWETIDARTVFKPGEQIRFRFRANFPGYLYVLDETSSGTFVWLFPDQNSGLNNQVQPDQWSLVPATQGAFGIPPTAGYETIYWVVSPAPLRDLNLEGSGPPRTIPHTTMVPRCEESVLQARGSCLDRKAGPKPLSDTARLQQIIGTGPSLRSRDIAFDRSSKSTRLKVRNLAGDALVYEFWIAHQ